jgi:hypothetical protein
LGNVLSAIDIIIDSMSDSIKHWYQCEGGKYYAELAGAYALKALAVAGVVALFVFTLPASGFIAT